MKTLTATILSIVLFVSLALLPAITSAQNTPDTYTNTDANSGTSLSNGITTNNTSSKGFNPMWLLPLLVVPIVYIIYKAANNDLTDTTYDRSSPLIGAKGGRASKEIDEESESENRDD